MLHLESVNSILAYRSVQEFESAVRHTSPLPYDHQSRHVGATRLIADGTAVEFAYARRFGNGIGEVFMPIEGAAMVLQAGRFGEPDQVELLAAHDRLPKPIYSVRLIEKGHLTLDFGKVSRRLGPGDGLVSRIDGGNDRRLIPDPDESHRYAHFFFTQTSIERLTALMGTRVPPVLAALQTAQSAESSSFCLNRGLALTNFIRSLWLTQAHGRVQTIVAGLKIAELFSMLCQAASIPRRHSEAGITYSEARRAHAAKTILDTHFDNPPGLPYLAAEVGLNRDKLCKSFRAVFGTSIAQYAKERRLQLGHKLLSERDASIAQVARRCGYGHQRNFSRAFAAHFGKPPSEIRRD